MAAVEAAAGSVETTTSLSIAKPGWRETPYSSLSYYSSGVDDGISSPLPTRSMEQGPSSSSSSSSSFEVLMDVLLGLMLAGFTLLTVLGNALVLHAVRTDRKLQTVCNMFIVSLAVADLVVGLVVMPISAIYVFTEDWLFGVALCQLWIGVDYTASTASILNLLILSLDRYWSVTNPLKYLRKRTRARGLVMISVVWVLSSLWIIPIVGWHHFVNEGVRTIPSTVCDTEYARSSILKITTSILNFYLPLAIMYVLYIRIFVEIRRRSLIEVCERIQPTTTESFSSESLHLADTDPSSVLDQPKHGRFLRRPSRLSFCLRQRRSERSSTRKSGHLNCRRQMSEPLRSRAKEIDVVCSGLAGKTGGCGGEFIAMERLRNRIYDRIALKKDATPSERTGDRVLDQGVNVIAGDERCEKVLLLKGMSLEETADEPDNNDDDGRESRSDDVASSSNDSLPERKKGVDDGETGRRSLPSKETWNAPDEDVEGVDSDSVFAGQLTGSTVELARNQKADSGILSLSKRGSRRTTALLNCLRGQTLERESTVDRDRCRPCRRQDGQTLLCELPAIRNIRFCEDIDRTCLSSPASSVSSRNSDCSGFDGRLSSRNVVHGGGSAEDGTLPHRVRLPKEAHPVKGRIINRSVVDDSSFYRTCSQRKQQNTKRNNEDDRSKKTTQDNVRGFNGTASPLRRTPTGHKQNGHSRRYLYLALTQRSSNPNPVADKTSRRKLKTDRSVMGSKGSGSSSLQKEIKAARQVGVIMGAFTICFLPYFVCFTVVCFCEWCNNARLMTAVTWFGYLNSTLNPFLYPLCNVNFRRKFRQMLSPASAAAAANNRDAVPISRQMSVRGVSRLQQPGSRSRMDSVLDQDRN